MAPRRDRSVAGNGRHLSAGDTPPPSPPTVTNQPSTASEQRFEQSEIVRALEVVKADPKMAPERTIKTLRWKGATERRRAGPPWWLAWIVGLFTWLDQSGRMLIWCTAAVLAALLVMYVVRLMRRFEAPRPDNAFVAPTHVGDLDIRPERLPADIGAAARALWDRGEHGEPWLCSIADCSHGWRTCTVFLSAIRAPKASASRWRRRI